MSAPSRGLSGLSLDLNKMSLNRNNLSLDRNKLSLDLNNLQPKTAKLPSPSPPQHAHCSHNIMHMMSQTTGTLSIRGELYEYSAEDLADLGEIGRGNFGAVNKMLHKESNTTMAVKRIRASLEEKEQKQLLKELDIVMNSSDCQFIVEFYGAIFKEGDCWICMELMATSLDRVYKAVHKLLKETIPEEILGKIAFCIVKALDYLKTHLRIIHRDIKPSNVLLDSEGRVKLCDFGISGSLVDSIARTRDAGCQPYMAPERIDPFASRQGYDVRSDVWSLGITLIEIATGKFPYPKWNSLFDQLEQVVQGTPPQLKSSDKQTFSPECLQFVNSCMERDYSKRQKYDKLLLHPYLVRHKDLNIGLWLQDVVNKEPNMFTLQIETETS